MVEEVQLRGLAAAGSDGGGRAAGCESEVAAKAMHGSDAHAFRVDMLSWMA